MVRRRRSSLRCKQMSAAVLAALISLMLSAAVAGAITLINCTGTNPCEGTGGADKIQDSAGDDVIYGYGGNDDVRTDDGNDTVYLGDGNDKIYGDSASSVYGEEGDDTIDSSGIPQSALLDGGPGDDYINAENWSDEIGKQTVEGGPGDDWIYAADGYPDVINCGGGKRDHVEFDRGGVDTVTKCEKKHAL
jgi:Ca2+-binding RTX toxin-like protein